MATLKQRQLKALQDSIQDKWVKICYEYKRGKETVDCACCQQFLKYGSNADDLCANCPLVVVYGSDSYLGKIGCGICGYQQTSDWRYSDLLQEPGCDADMDFLTALLLAYEVIRQGE